MSRTTPLILLALVFYVIAFGQESHGPHNEADLLDRYEKATDPEEKLAAYEELMHYYYQHDNDDEVLRSLSHNTLAWIKKKSPNEDIIRRAHYLYFRNVPRNFADSTIVERIKETCKSAQESDNHEEMYEACYSSAYALTRMMTVMPEVRDLAVDNADEAFDDARKLNDPKKKIRALLIHGRALALKLKFKDAFEKLLEAETLIVQQDDEIKEQFKYELYQERYFIMKEWRDWDEAAKLKKKRIEYLLNQKPIDSIQVMWERFDLYAISERSGEYLQDVDDYKTIIEFAKRHDLGRLKHYVSTALRGYLIKEERFDQLKEFYEVDNPGQLDSLEKYRPLNFYMAKGYITEADKGFEGALTYYEKADSILTNAHEKNPNRAVIQLNELGKVHLRNGNSKKALEYHMRAHEIFEEKDISNDNEMVAIKSIEKIAYDQKEFELAYEYSIKRQELERKWNNMEEREAIMRLAFQTEEEIEEISAQKEYKAKKAKHAVQNWAIAAGLVILVVVMLLLSRMQVAEWVIEMMSFFVVLFIFEFVILTLDHELHYATEGAPLPMFLAKVALLSFLFPLHHVIEKSVLGYMKRRELLKDPNQSIPASMKRGLIKTLGVLWPWLDPDRKSDH